MNHLKRIMAESDDFFWTQQHANPMNPFAYEQLISGSLEEFAHIDYLVCSTGTGGFDYRHFEENPGDQA